MGVFSFYLDRSPFKSMRDDDIRLCWFEFVLIVLFLLPFIARDAYA